MVGGEEGLERDREARDVIFVVLCDDKIGEGAWICIDMAKVGALAGGMSARAMYEEGGGRHDGVDLCEVRRT